MRLGLIAIFIGVLLACEGGKQDGNGGGTGTSGDTTATTDPSATTGEPLLDCEGQLDEASCLARGELCVWETVFPYPKDLCADVEPKSLCLELPPGGPAGCGPSYCGTSEFPIPLWRETADSVEMIPAGGYCGIIPLGFSECGYYWENGVLLGGNQPDTCMCLCTSEHVDVHACEISEQATAIAASAQNTYAFVVDKPERLYAVTVDTVDESGRAWLRLSLPDAIPWSLYLSEDLSAMAHTSDSVDSPIPTSQRVTTCEALPVVHTIADLGPDLWSISFQALVGKEFQLVVLADLP